MKPGSDLAAHTPDQRLQKSRWAANPRRQNMDAELRIAYLTSAYARPGDTFIRNEVNELRRLGATVDTYSIRRPVIDADAEADIVSHQKTTDYILEAGL